MSHQLRCVSQMTAASIREHAAAHPAGAVRRRHTLHRKTYNGLISCVVHPLKQRVREPLHDVRNPHANWLA